MASNTPEISEHRYKALVMGTQPHAGCNYSEIYSLFQFGNNFDE
jgi:hypothetical protein